MQFRTLTMRFCAVSAMSSPRSFCIVTRRNWSQEQKKHNRNRNVEPALHEERPTLACSSIGGDEIVAVEFFRPPPRTLETEDIGIETHENAMQFTQAGHLGGMPVKGAEGGDRLRPHRRHCVEEIQPVRRSCSPVESRSS